MWWEFWNNTILCPIGSDRVIASKACHCSVPIVSLPYVMGGTITYRTHLHTWLSLPDKYQCEYTWHNTSSKHVRVDPTLGRKKLLRYLCGSIWMGSIDSLPFKTCQGTYLVARSLQSGDTNSNCQHLQRASADEEPL